MAPPLALIDLDTITQKTFTLSVSRANPEASQADVQGVWSTISTLLTRVSPNRSPLLIPGAHALAPHDRTPSREVSFFLAELSQAAHKAATSCLCSSILAGGGSESDEFSDISFFLGNIQDVENPSVISEVLKILGLESWLYNAEIEEIRDAGPLPLSLKLLASRRTSSKLAVDLLTKVLDRMTNTFEFRIVTFGAGGLMLHVYAGCVEGAWVGLAGMSTQADEGY